MLIRIEHAIWQLNRKILSYSLIPRNSLYLFLSVCPDISVHIPVDPSTGGPDRISPDPPEVRRSFSLHQDTRLQQMQVHRS